MTESQQQEKNFNGALRAVLMAQVDAAPKRKRARKRLWLGVGVVAAAGLFGTVSAGAAGILSCPGADQVNIVGEPIEGTHTGTVTLDIGPQPAGATDLIVDFTCLSPGFFEIADGGTVDCPAAGFDSSSSTWGRFDVSVAKGQSTMTIKAPASAKWKAKVMYAKYTPTKWAVNAHGQTYGVANADGQPVLLAVLASNGSPGYVFSSELNDASGVTAMKTIHDQEKLGEWMKKNRSKDIQVPVYQSDGTTVVGAFLIPAHKD